MDIELLIALLVLWFSTTTALVNFLRMWFSFNGEAFHPHSVDVEHRHGLFLSVNSRTICKLDCPVKSISIFVAPRGSSSSKQFTVLSCMIGVAGFLGTARWYAVGEVELYVAILCFVGFASILLVAAFELDVIPERFLEDKLLVTGWLIEKLNYPHPLPFTLGLQDEGFRKFIRQSKEIYYLYEEDVYIVNRPRKHTPWIYHHFWSTLHMLGACTYVFLLPCAILLHDPTEAKVAWITGMMFTFFCMLSYLSGEYLPVFSWCRCWVLVWNPFLREPHFLWKLKKSLDNYCQQLDRQQQLQHQASYGGGGKANTSSKKKAGTTANKRNKQIQQTKLLSLSSAAATALLSSSTPPRSNSPLMMTTDYTVSKQQRSESSSSIATSTTSSIVNNNNSPPMSCLLEDLDTFHKESAALDKQVIGKNYFLYFARYHPQSYLRILGHIAVMSELIAMMTPSVALGLQWVTALCEGPSLLSVIDLLLMTFSCLRAYGDCTFSPDKFQHCILKT